MDSYQYLILSKGLNATREVVHVADLPLYYGLNEIYTSIEYLHDSIKDKDIDPVGFTDRKIKDVWIDVDPDESSTLEKQWWKVHNDLIKYGIKDEHIQLYFSGRGLHIRLPNLWAFDTIDEMKNTLTDIVPQTDLIQNTNRIIRLVNTCNDKTGLFKIPLYDREFDNLAQIASKGSNSDFKTLYHIDPYLESKKKKSPLRTHVWTSERHSISEPYRLNCVHNILREGLVEGYRHTRLFSIIKSLRMDGWDKDSIYAICDAHIQGNLEKGELDKIINDIFDKGYKTSCRDPVLTQFCDSKCLFYARAIRLRNNDVDIDVRGALRDKLNQKPLIDLQPIFKLGHPYGIFRKDLVSIQGRAGQGKTSIMCFIASKLRACLKYIPLEDTPGAIALKYARFNAGRSKQNLIESIDDIDLSKLAISTVPGGILTISEAIREIQETEADIIFIDHLGKIVEDTGQSGWDGMMSKTYALKGIAEQTGKVLIVSSHTGRRSEHSVQGATEISASSVIKINQLYEAMCTGCNRDQYVTDPDQRFFNCDFCTARTYHIVEINENNPEKYLELSTHSSKAGKTRENMEWTKRIKINLSTLEVEL